MEKTDISKSQQEEIIDNNRFAYIDSSTASLHFLQAFEKLEALMFPHIQFIRYCPSLPPKELESLYKIQLYLEKYHSIFHNLYELSLPDKLSDISPVSIDTKNFLNAVIDITAKLFPCKSLFISTDISDGCETAFIDIRRTELILYNLISNAIIHNPRREKHIKISAFPRGDDLVISVKDNGKGFPSSAVLKRFNDDNETLLQDVYFDFQTASMTHIGIALIKKLVKQMNGKVKFYSTQKGVTAEVSISQSYFALTNCVKDSEAVGTPSFELAFQQLSSAMLLINFTADDPGEATHD